MSHQIQTIEQQTSRGSLADAPEAAGQLVSLGGSFDVADLCLLSVLSGRNAEIHAGGDGAMSRLVLEDGALVHASTGELQGLAAFKLILGWSQLEFEWMPASPDGAFEKNVRLDASWLLKIARWRQAPEGWTTATSRAEGIISGVSLKDLLELMDKKRESGTITLSTAGHFGMLVLRDGQIVQADTDGHPNPAAADEMHTWKNLRVAYIRSAPPTVLLPAENLLAELEHLVGELADELEGVLTCALVRLSDGRAIVDRANDPAFAGALASYATVVRSHLAAARQMNGGALGSTEDLMIFLDNAALLVRMVGPDHFLGLILEKTSNPALGRFLARRIEPLLLAILDQAGV
jgi:predicted regulator of Ras-like GTPase activity (Roadblock/LC7/MglB family)